MDLDLYGDLYADFDKQCDRVEYFDAYVDRYAVTHLDLDAYLDGDSLDHVDSVVDSDSHLVVNADWD
jgi:hypothetical protein